MLPEAAAIPAVNEIAPIRQGDLENVCGLCSIVNGIYVATAQAGRKLDRGDLRRLYRHGIRLLSKDRRLTSVLHGGISEAMWLRLCARMVDFAGEATGVSLSRRSLLPSSIKQLDTRAALQAMRREIVRGRPILLILHGVRHHATVIVGYSATRFRLFDSSGLHSITISLTGLEHDRSTKRHQIAPASVISLTAAEGSDAGGCDQV